MKMVIILIAASLVAIFFSSYTFAQQGKTKQKVNVTTSFYVQSISCNNCIKAIENSISFEKGVTAIKCDLPSKTVAITYNPARTSDEALIKAFAKIKREATIVTPDNIQ